MTEVSAGTLTDFLLARLSDDEAVARAATVGRWYFDEDFEWHGIGNVHSETEPGVTGFVAHDHDREQGIGAVDSDDAKHIVLWQPARVLAECEAKRRIVALHGGEPYPNPEDELVDTACTSFGADLRWPDECKTLMLLALPYAGHAEFNPAWRL